MFSSPSVLEITRIGVTFPVVKVCPDNIEDSLLTKQKNRSRGFVGSICFRLSFTPKKAFLKFCHYL